MQSRKPLFGARGISSLCIVAAIICWGASGASAAAVPLPANATLQDLINLNASGGVQVGNFTFSDFSFTPTTGSPTNPAPAASQISVSTAPGPNVGLTFNSFWESIPGGNQDGIIRYAVQVAQGTVIDQVNLGFNGAAPVPSVGTNASVTETVSTLLTTGNNTPVGPGNAIGQLTVSNSVATGSTTTNNSTLTLAAPQQGIFVSKDVQVVSGPNGISTISWVDNTYHSTQGGPIIPEPASIGLLGVMGVGLLARRRRV
jgi:hypothetical protein